MLCRSAALREIIFHLFLKLINCSQLIFSRKAAERQRKYFFLRMLSGLDSHKL
jgi:hypothetical protein